MSLTIDAFRDIAKSTFFSSRDIAIQGEGDQAVAKLGNFIFSQSAKTNDATMAAFKSALAAKYGVFGIHAFDTVLGARQQLHKSLRASDITATLSRLDSVKYNRYIGEINRQLDTSPKFRELSEGMRQLVRANIADNPLNGDLKNCDSIASIVKMASKRIDKAIQDTNDFVARKKETNPGYDVDTDTHIIEGRKTTEISVKGNEPTGLRRLMKTFTGGETSVEDQIKRGTLGVGMRINRSNTHPVILDKLKSNGVEPGFIYRNDWSKDDTRGFMADIDSQASRDALKELQDKDPAFAEKCKGKSRREQILIAGRAHPAGMAAATELLIEEAAKLVLAADKENKSINDMAAPDSVKSLAKAIKGHFANTADISHLASGSSNSTTKAVFLEAKKELFTDIRDAVMNTGPKNADNSDNPLYARSPVFKHFNDRSIVKLDYNEGDKFSGGAAAQAGTFMRPERILASRKPILGQIYRFTSRQSADDISAGAITEAIANDLTRLAGVPSQELEIVRGQYSDGHPKIMLAAKFANGYKDMEAGMLSDGRVVPPLGADAKLQMESLGKYKAFFLVTADRDGVGKRGQNKGFINGKFFAIDPGHSLEGNGKYLEISDDFSFRDTYGKSTKPRFNNFSVFDDDTRFAKLQGLVNLRDIARSGAFERLFTSYMKAFDPEEEGISDAEKTMRTKAHAEIKKKQAEFNESLSKLLRVGGMQLELYDALAGDGAAMQEGGIETIANLEKLCSPTTWVSKNRLVALNHLEVLPKTRIPWRAGVEGNNIVYHCDRPIPERARELLQEVADNNGVKYELDGFGTTRLIVPKDRAAAFFAAFNEDKVAEMTHPREFTERHTGGDGLLESVYYEPFEPATDYKDPRPTLTAAQLPEVLDLEDSTGRVIHLPKVHYETMATTACSGVHRPRSIEELRAQLEARIKRGSEIMRALETGNVSRFEASEQNIAALTIALHIAALKKGEYMYRGSFSVEDPAGNIARWLDSSPDVYLRSSTHARPYQQMQVDGHLNMPRGYDVREGMGGLLNGMRTFHYFSIPDLDHMNDVDKGSGPKRRLFLKCETYGIYWSTAQIHRTDMKNARSEGMHTRWARFGNVFESVEHMMSLFSSFFTPKDAPGIRKENLPPKVANLIRNAEMALRVNGFIPLAEKANLTKVLNGGGVKMFLDNINAEMRKMPGDRTEKVMEVLGPYLIAIDKEFTELAGNMDQRMGNEIMIDAKDFR
ncbi:MAG: hypothetical protein IJU44_11055 [Kiritimatiellae bacterium]|nr:hypothetical protein [Kiritimatiellia bacterium]